VIQAIVVGTDGSETAERAVREAGDVAKCMEAKVHVVSAYEPASGAKVAGADADPERADWVVGPNVQVDSVLERAVGMLKAQGVEVEAHARRGDPADALLQVAEEEKADVIVVGNKGMTGAKRFLLGSVPDKISHHAPCSVLIVRTT
jgi:nucleotide-binding universal stress UspA family protein